MDPFIGMHAAHLCMLLINLWIAFWGIASHSLLSICQLMALDWCPGWDWMSQLIPVKLYWSEMGRICGLSMTQTSSLNSLMILVACGQQCYAEVGNDSPPWREWRQPENLVDVDLGNEIPIDVDERCLVIVSNLTESRMWLRVCLSPVRLYMQRSSSARDSKKQDWSEDSQPNKAPKDPNPVEYKVHKICCLTHLRWLLQHVTE